MESSESTSNVVTRKLPCVDHLIVVGETCIAEINGQFFLLVEIEIDVPCVDIEQVVVFRLCPAEAQALLDAGVATCTIVNEIPEGAEFRCVLVVDNQAFLVFEVENATEELVLVRADLCPIIG
ncbi:MAG: hypothetical protein A4E53_01100 [Pelotomaculum sp. PtaB.Bin104]|nr:MAG: hypothetical protein A4E53_01100 [Pelotomaculum sp. PtaB.Bin104]